ncbi:hypothetical protein SAM40697_6883 [Streptomyces ambofaciens]|uniref:Uncharacterized protein n=1 Tax=Streptomyces ambofaciens TaxID=1889 RepID=A0ABN4NYI3_STRAM|nr:hypothetical protein SAM40697_0042 [Streptomyces ambofaciens]ANB10835.1 hypothetical protein SAM40697_6883 [Streptomyces ambofaciens]
MNFSSRALGAAPAVAEADLAEASGCRTAQLLFTGAGVLGCAAEHRLLVHGPRAGTRHLLIGASALRDDLVRLHSER